MKPLGGKTLKRLELLVTVLTAALLSSCVSYGAGGNADTVAKEEVQAATAAWVAAYDSGDAARVSAQYAPDAVLLGTNSMEVRASPAAIAEYFTRAGRSPGAKVVIGEHHIRVYGSVAINTGHYTFFSVRDGKLTPRPARFSMVFHKREGKWILVDHHSSRV